MIINNKLDKSFGPVGSFSGIVVFAAGLISIFYSLSALILLLIGWFLGFSYSCTLIDVNKKRIRFSNTLFGIIKTGQWMDIKTDMKIGIRNSTKVWRSYSQSNRTLDIENKDFRLILYDSSGKMIMPILKVNNLNSAKSELEKICRQLGLSPVS